MLENSHAVYKTIISASMYLLLRLCYNPPTMRNKAIFIIPGYRQSATSKTYQEIAATFRNEGFSPILVKIPWKNSTISDNTEYFLEKYKKIKARRKYILGFSYGAMIAFITTTKVSASGLILCSLSPYFKEDLPKKTTAAQSMLMIDRFNDFQKFHSGKIAKATKAKKVLMLYGAQESLPLIRRVVKTFSKIPSKKHLIKVSRTEHEIGNHRYLNAISKATHEFL